MNKVILKIKKDMWKEIKSGNKIYEIRKLNKDYIQEGFIIKFVDMNTGYILGERKVLKKQHWLPKNVVELINHVPTVEFVKENYMNEIRLIVFELDCGQYVQLD